MQLSMAIIESAIFTWCLSSRRYKADKEHVRQLVLDLVEKELVKPVGGAGVPAGLSGNWDLWCEGDGNLLPKLG